MSKLIGKRKQEYLAYVVSQEPAVDLDTAEALSKRLDDSIRSLRVTKTDLAGLKSGPGTAKPAITPVKSASPPFDPYAFNAILVYKRMGRDGLVGKLAEIGEVSHLRQLAEAQLIGLDQAMRTGPVGLEELRSAVLRGVERLVADRRAAAS